LIDPKGFGNGGIAYGNCHGEHKLNSVRDEMSPWIKNQFHEWCKSKGLGDDVLCFENRAMYGEFITEQLQWAELVLEQRGAKFERHNTSISKLARNGKNFDLVDEDGLIIVENVEAENINLTLGYGPNDNFQNLWQYDGAGYIHSPYHHDKIIKITESKPSPRIAFIGTGPALYDFVNQCDGNPADITLYAFSREGRFLDVRDTSIEADEVSIVPDYIADESFIPTSLAELKKVILADFKAAAEAGNRSPRRVALDIMKNIKPLLERVSYDLAVEFKKSAFLSYLKGRATPIPAESKKRLDSFDPIAVKGKLNGNIERLDDGTFRITNDGQEPIIVDYIVNGTGHRRLNHPLIQNLISDGLAELDERFDTLKTDNTGSYKLSGSGINSFGPATHFGIDGMESFAQYVEPFIRETIERFIPQKHSTLPPGQEPSPAHAAKGQQATIS
jgi:hypothetical protein